MKPMHRNVRLASAGVILITTLLLVVGAWNVIRGFFPSGRQDAAMTSASGDRVFTHVTGFVDLSIDLRAVDFPHTFWKPAYVGDLYWPEVFASREVFWSEDRTLIAIRTQRVGDSSLRFTDAYDFRDHREIHEQVAQVDAEITALMSARGGIGPRLQEIVDEKGDTLRAGFPAWGWIPPAVIFCCGVALVIRLAAGPRVD